MSKTFSYPPELKLALASGSEELDQLNERTTIRDTRLHGHRVFEVSRGDKPISDRDECWRAPICAVDHRPTLDDCCRRGDREQSGVANDGREADSAMHNQHICRTGIARRRDDQVDVLVSGDWQTPPTERRCVTQTGWVAHANSCRHLPDRRRIHVEAHAVRPREEGNDTARCQLVVDRSPGRDCPEVSSRSDAAAPEQLAFDRLVHPT